MLETILDLFPIHSSLRYVVFKMTMGCLHIFQLHQLREQKVKSFGP